MKTNLSMVAALFTVALLTACGSKPDTTAQDDAMNALAEGPERIRIMEDSLYAHPKVDTKAAQALLDVYLLYARTKPLDPLAPEYLLRAAGIKTALNDPQGALVLYDRIIKDYPSWDRSADAYYLKAFTLDNGMHIKGLAQQAYQEVIDRFPRHPFAKDAAQMIENLNYTDDELIARFKRMNDSIAPAAAEK